MKILIALMFLGLVALTWAKSTGSSSRNFLSLFKRDGSYVCKGDGNALDEECSWTAWDRCCDELQCSKKELIGKGTCKICKETDSYCTKDSQCCSGECNWRGKCIDV